MNRPDLAALLCLPLLVVVCGRSPAVAGGAQEKPASPAGAAPCECAQKPALPVAMRADFRHDGWALGFSFPPCSAYTDLFVRIDSQPEESTGHDRELDVMTGRPRIRTWTVVPHERLGPGEHKVTVRMVRADGGVDGPFTLRFHPGEERLAEAKSALAEASDEAISFSEHGSAWTWLNFHLFFDRSDSLREVRYSIDGCALDRRLVFDGGPIPERDRALEEYQATDLTPDRPFLTLPLSTRSVASRPCSATAPCRRPSSCTGRRASRTRTERFAPSTWRREPGGQWRIVLDSGCPPCACP